MEAISHREASCLGSCGCIRSITCCMQWPMLLLESSPRASTSTLRQFAASALATYTYESPSSLCWQLQTKHTLKVETVRHT